MVFEDSLHNNNNMIEKRIGKVSENDDEYKEICMNVKNAKDKYDELELTDKERDVIEKYLDVIERNVDIYAQCAYETAFKDCKMILEGLKIIKKDN